MSEAPYRVLIVDDHEDNRVLAAAFLKPLGCEVTVASDGLECLRAVERRPPDLILLDVMMPGMDGLTACRWLKQHAAFHHIPIVLITALNATSDRVAGIEAGADDFVTKPFNRQELMARVRSLLRVKRLAESERLHLRQTLERYVDSAVAQILLDTPEIARPGGQRREASVLFADIRGFSTWSEDIPPESVVEVMNTFLGSAIDVVFRNGGTVDKFTGDGLMAIFGAPLRHAAHAQRAVAAALGIIGAAEAITHLSLTEPLPVGCGVNSGEMVIGNIGSERRLDYTAMGDVVNVARRLSDEARGGQVLVSEATFRGLAGAATEDLGHIPVKGRHAPVHVFTVSSLAHLEFAPRLSA
ncbi:MAG: hypothetical protein QOF51_2909 [Chloroflexota bacterium]|jgi:adenylate cyclase|nr:hypothetical protein [Chloroflexota bacterium]